MTQRAKKIWGYRVRYRQVKNGYVGEVTYPLSKMGIIRELEKLYGAIEILAWFPL